MRGFAIALLAVGIALGGASCAKNNTETNMNSPETINQETQTQPNTDVAVADTQATFAPGSYTVNAETSQMNWEGRKTLIKDYKDTGTINIQEGTVNVGPDGTVTGTVVFDMTSIKTLTTGKNSGESMMEKHIKSDDFFGVETYPTSTIAITEVKPIDDGSGATHMVSGNLTIKDITNPISFPATITQENGQIKVVASVEVDRTLWNIRYGSDKFFDNLANNVIDDFFTVAFTVNAQAAQQ